MTHFLDAEPQRDEEWEAWKELARRLHDAPQGVPDVNDARWNPVIDQIKYWGETLHRLRLADPEHDEKAYREARTAAHDGREALTA